LQECSLAAAVKYFDALPESDQIEFQLAIDEGRPQANPTLQRTADAFRAALDAMEADLKREKVLKSWVEDYFPRRFRNPGSTAPVNPKDFNAKVYGRRPLGGSKRALRQRTFKYLQDALDAGFVMEDTNPARTLQNHLYDMSRALMEARLQKALKAQGNLKF